MVQTAFWASSTNTGAMPPSIHFFTQAGLSPRCLAPHIESDIQPFNLVASAARAAIAVRAKTANRRVRTLFTRNLQGIGKSLSTTIILHWPQFGKKFCGSGFHGVCILPVRFLLRRQAVPPGFHILQYRLVALGGA